MARGLSLRALARDFDARRLTRVRESGTEDMHRVDYKDR
jgi:hypothetical protein